MRLRKFKNSVYSAIAFFVTLGALSVGYSAYVSNYPATASTGATVSSDEWNKIVTALQTLDTNSVPPGAVTYFAMANCPSGWMKANGALVSRSTYSALFGAVGTTFGAGDGSTTFKLPDLRGEFVRGTDDGRWVDTGRTLGSSQAQDVQPHAHSYVGFGNTASLWQYVDNTGNAYVNNYNGTTGNNAGSETRPRNVALLACIKH